MERRAGFLKPAICAIQSSTDPCPGRPAQQTGAAGATTDCWSQREKTAALQFERRDGGGGVPGSGKRREPSTIGHRADHGVGTRPRNSRTKQKLAAVAVSTARR